MPDGPQVGLGYADIIASVEVTGLYQVVFHLKHPFAPFLALMAFSGSSIVNPKLAPNTAGQAVQYAEGDARAGNPNDLGPYLLTEWSRKAGKDYEMKLDANPYYFNAANVKAQHVILKFYSDATALSLAIKSGDIDMAFRQLSSTDIQSMQSDSSVKVWEGTGAFIQYICFQEKMAPFDNAQFRQAFAQAIDRKELTQTVFLGQANPLYSMIPNGMAFQTDAYKTIGDANQAPLISMLQGMGYSESATNPMASYGLGLLALGVIVIIAGAAMTRRKKA